MFPTRPRKNIYFHILISISLQKKEIISIIHLIHNIKINKIDFDNFKIHENFFDHVESLGKY